MKNIFSVIKSKSPKYILFRSKYEFERRTGLLALKFPTYPKKVKLPSLEEWRNSKAKYLFDDRNVVAVPKRPSSDLAAAAKRVLKGEVRFFSHEWKQLGLDWDYMTNPENGYHYDKNLHWTKVNDFDEAAGDIKFVWEPSRFSSLYTIVRNDYHNDEDHSEFVIGRILDWIDKNSLNCGPNYKCSQETSLRVLNWLFAVNFYKNSVALTEDRWNKIIESVYWQFDHVYQNIDFSRICVRNNHAITETLTLYLAGLLFPEMPGAAKWKRDGKRWFEEEIEYQFEPDGSYLQQSMNYQRVVTQLLTLGIALAEKNGERFNDIVYQRANANLNFLFQLQDEKSGKLPNYGSNDGALFFPLNDADYRDYRPQLDALHYVLTGKRLYAEEHEDAGWFGITLNNRFGLPDPQHKNGMVVFKNGGYYVVRRDDRMVFIRYGGFRAGVPTDLMHLDVWRNGENVLMDCGTYKYNTEEKWKLYFAGTESANAVMLGENGQKQKGPRFMWFLPSRLISGGLKETLDGYLFEGCIETFRALGDGVEWHRVVRMNKELTEFEVADKIVNKPAGLPMRQIWHTCSEGLIFESDGQKNEKTGWYSDYYGLKAANKQIEFIAKENIVVTNIKIKL